MRRDYIDSILTRTFAQFGRAKRDYNEIMRQRNALLKKIREGEADRKNLDAWDNMFVEKAILYHTYRKQWCQWITEHREDIKGFLPKYQISFSYTSSIDEK